MARAELRLINGCVLENLPSVCMYCGAPVSKYSTVQVTHGNKSLEARLPLCQRDRVSWLADLQTRIANGMIYGAAGKGGLLGVGLVAAGHIMNASRDDRFIPVDDAHPKFIRALVALRKQELDEFERNLIQASSKTDEPPNAFAGLADETPVLEEVLPPDADGGGNEARPVAAKAPAGKKPPDRKWTPWIIGGGILAAGMLLVCGGILFAVIRAVKNRANAPHPPIVLETNCREISTMAFHLDGRTLAIGGRDRTVKRWDLLEQKFLGEVPSPGNNVFSLGYSRDDKYLVVTTTDHGGKIRVLHADTHQPTGDDFPGTRFALSPDGLTLLTTDGEAVHRFDLATRRKLASWKPLNGHFNGFEFAPDGRTFAVALVARENKDPVKLCDATNGQVRASLGGRVNRLSGLAYSPTGKRLAVSSEDGTVRIFDTETLRLLLRCDVQDEPIESVTFSRDGSLLVSAGQNGAVRVWDAANGKQLALRRVQSGVVAVLLFSPDNRNLLAAAGSKVYVWDVAEFRPR